MGKLLQSKEQINCNNNGNYWYAAGNPPYCDTSKDTMGKLLQSINCNNSDSYWYAAGNPPYCDTSKYPTGRLKSDGPAIDVNTISDLPSDFNVSCNVM